MGDECGGVGLAFGAAVCEEVGGGVEWGGPIGLDGGKGAKELNVLGKLGVAGVEDEDGGEGL